MTQTFQETLPRLEEQSEQLIAADGNNPIQSWDELKSTQLKDIGLVITSRVIMDDGSRFIYRQISPKTQKSDISVDFSPPLGTKVNGYNTYMAIQIVKAGIPTRIIGTDQTHGHNLRHASKATHLILNEADNISSLSSPGESIMIGYSMGAMKAMGMLSLASQYNRNIPFTLGLDPCLAKAMNYNEHNPFELAIYLAKETQELGKIMLNDIIEENPIQFLKRTKYYLESIEVSPQFITNIWDKWKTLCSGETGVLASEVPIDASMVLHFFNRSIFNNQESFKDIFSSHPNIKLIGEDAYHISGGNHHIVDRVVDKLKLAEKLISEKVNPTDLVDCLSSPIIINKNIHSKVVA